MNAGQGPAAWDDATLVDRGGYRLAFRQAGQGQPVVVLEMGLRVAGTRYDHIARRVAALTRVVEYDHPGLGHSDPAPMPRTVADLAANLHALLHASRIPAPYVLAGHSLGGLTVRYYQQRYPADVAALVLIDAAHEDQRERLLAALPPERPDEPSARAQYRAAVGTRWADPSATDERIDNRARTALMRQCAPFDDLPLVMVSRGRIQAPACAHATAALLVRRIGRRDAARGQARRRGGRLL
jgi:pimeloyl-ACP methyl ester carboxylesterase